MSSQQAAGIFVDRMSDVYLFWLCYIMVFTFCITVYLTFIFLGYYMVLDIPRWEDINRFTGLHLPMNHSKAMSACSSLIFRRLMVGYGILSRSL